MSYLSDVTLRDGAQLDAFGRLRVSEQLGLFDNMNEYGNNAYFWETSVTNGSITAQANQCSLRLSTGGTASGNKAIRQTKQYFRYQPGRSLTTEQTFVMSAAQTNSYTRLGYYDASNGIFFERNGSTLNIVRRTNVTGTPTDNTVAQSSWNLDKLDGTGASGLTLDVTKTQILHVDLQYLGVGRVRVGFVINGQLIYAHQFLNANVLATVYMSSGCLPIRQEVVNSGTAGGTITMDVICVTVTASGEGNNRVQFARSNAATAITTGTTVVPLISLRAATLFGGTSGGGSIANRGHIVPIEFSLLVKSQDHEYQIQLNPTLTGASWQNNNTSASIADYDVSATAISAAGTILASGYVQSGAGAVAGSALQQITAVLPLVYSGLNSTQDILTLAARTVTGSGSAYGALIWQEEY